MADKVSKFIFPVKSGTQIANKEFELPGGGDTNTFVGTTAEWNALTTEQQNAYNCRVLTDDDLEVVEVINNLNSDSSTDALSAKQGKVLKGLVDTTQQMIAPILTSLVAPTGGLASGDQFIYNGLLYKATAEIAQGGTITINGNCALADSVTEQIRNIPKLTISQVEISCNGTSGVGDGWMYGQRNVLIPAGKYVLIFDVVNNIDPVPIPTTANASYISTDGTNDTYRISAQTKHGTSDVVIVIYGYLS